MVVAAGAEEKRKEKQRSTSYEQSASRHLCYRYIYRCTLLYLVTVFFFTNQQMHNISC